MTFQNFIRLLLPNTRENPKEKMIRGVQVFFPETVFFDKGKPGLIVLNDKDFCLTKLNEPADGVKLMSFLDIRKKL